MIGFPKPTKKRKLTPLEKAIAKAAERQGVALKGQNKFGAVAKDGFPSTLERDTYSQLLLRETAGEIRNLRRQVRVELTEARIPCKIDFGFEFVADGEPGYAEAKGKETQFWRNYVKLWRKYGTAKLEIWKAGRQGPVLVEVITPVKQEEDKK